MSNDIILLGIYEKNNYELRDGENIADITQSNFDIHEIIYCFYLVNSHIY